MYNFALLLFPLPVGAATEATRLRQCLLFKAEDSASADGDLGMVLLAQRRTLIQLLSAMMVTTQR